MQNNYLIYVAGKLNDDACGYIKNLHRMIEWGNMLLHCGFQRHIPGLDLLCGLLDGNFDYSDYFNSNQLILERCDAVFLVPEFETSEGTKREIETANRLNIPIFYPKTGMEGINNMIKHFEEKEDVLA